MTNELVNACLPDKESCRRAWHRRVMKDWDVNKEDVGEILGRMNRFLWSQAEAIEIITNVIETGSYVSCMRKKTAEIKREGKPVFVSSLPSLFQGFSLLASTSSEPFALQKISSQRLREIRSNLRVLARLPGRLLLFMGPVRRAKWLLEEDGNQFEWDDEKKKISKMPWEHLKEAEGETSLQTEGDAGAGVKGERQTEDKCEHDEDNAGSSSSS